MDSATSFSRTDDDEDNFLLLGPPCSCHTGNNWPPYEGIIGHRQISLWVPSAGIDSQIDLVHLRRFGKTSSNHCPFFGATVCWSLVDKCISSILFFGGLCQSYPFPVPDADVCGRDKCVQIQKEFCKGKSLSRVFLRVGDRKPWILPGRLT